MSGITVYSKPNCQACRATYRKLNELHLAYDHVDITEDPDALTYILGLGFKEAPVVVSDNGSWSGYKPDRLKELAQ